MAEIISSIRHSLAFHRTEVQFLIIGLSEQLSKLAYPSDLFPTVIPAPLPCSSPVPNLGMFFNKNLTFSGHITQLFRTNYRPIQVHQ